MTVICCHRVTGFCFTQRRELFIFYYLTSISQLLFFFSLSESLNLGHGISGGKNLYLRHTEIWVYQFQFKIFTYKELSQNSRAFVVSLCRLGRLHRLTEHLCSVRYLTKYEPSQCREQDLKTENYKYVNSGASHLNLHKLLGRQKTSEFA